MKAIEHLRQKFEITINRPNMFVGLQISKADGILRISQTRFIKDLIKTYEMGDAKVANTPIPTTIQLTKSGCADVESTKVNVPYRQLVG